MSDLKLEGFIVTKIPLNERYRNDWDKGYELIDTSGGRSILLEKENDRILIATETYDGSSSAVFGTGDPLKYKTRKKFKDSDGYWEIEYPEHPRSRYSKGKHYIKTVAEHILVAEDNLGRQLLRSEVVHHMDMDTENNNPVNLLVLSSNEHTRIHQWLNGLIISYNELGLIRRDKGTNRCKNCSKPMLLGRVYCSAICFEDFNGVEQEYTPLGKAIKELTDSKNYDQNTLNDLIIKASNVRTKSPNKPDRDTLIKEIELYPFTTLGKKYGVSDTGVRKWCKNYGIKIPKILGKWVKVQYGHLPELGNVYH